MRRLLGIAAVLLVAGPLWMKPALAECYGEPGYEVCVDSWTDASGNIHSRTYDSEGNTYSMDVDSYTASDGSSVVRSYDSEGNSYEIKTWTDSLGAHTIDSEGNRCSVYFDGTTSGC